MIYDLIGTIYKETSITLTDDEGNEYPEMEAIEGYHVNVLPPSDIDLTQYIIEVTSPRRVFSGRDDTICLKFNSRDEWLELGIEVVEDENLSE